MSLTKKKKKKKDLHQINLASKRARSGCWIWKTICCCDWWRKTEVHFLSWRWVRQRNGRMAQALCRRRLKIVPVVYALSTLHQNVEFSTTLKAKWSTNEPEFGCSLPKFIPPCVSVYCLTTAHTPQRTGTKGSKGRECHHVCVGLVFFPRLHLASSPIFPVTFPLYIHRLMKQK